jgi:hypothetical protein
MTDFAHQFFIDSEDRDKAESLGKPFFRLPEIASSMKGLLHAHVFTTEEKRFNDEYLLVALISDDKVMENVGRSINEDGERILIYNASPRLKIAVVCMFNNVLAFQRFAAEERMAVHLSPNAVRKYIAA